MLDIIILSKLYSDKINFELLDTDKVGVVAYLQSPFSEIQMANVSGKFYHEVDKAMQRLVMPVNLLICWWLSVTKYFPMS
jgi:hypothetical protein